MVNYVPFFQDISENSVTLLKKHAAEKFLPKNELLFSCDNKANYFYFIVDGWVKLYRNTFAGDEVIIDILTKGGVFGEYVDLQDNKHNLCAKTISNVNIVSYPTNILKECIDNDHVLASNMIKISNQKQQNQMYDAEHLICQSATQRIGCFLLRLCDPKKQHDIIIDLPYDKFLIAARLGMKVETFSRSLTKLAEDTGIRVEGSRIHIINLDSLIDYTCDNCSKRFPCTLDNKTFVGF
ncbi:MAG: CRP-like cAMP-binding protein [Rickettsiales bacterium]|jgi:CRP-like cAMP-binding protein